MTVLKWNPIFLAIFLHPLIGGYGLDSNLDDLTRLVERIDLDLLGENIIVFGNFSKLHHLPIFTGMTNHHQIAVKTEAWLIGEEDGVQNSVLNEDGASITFLYLPTSPENFDAVFDKILTIFTTTNEELSWTQNQRIFLLKWPSPVAAEEENEQKTRMASQSGTNDINAILQHNDLVASIRRKGMVIPKHEHVYIIWLPMAITNEIWMPKIIEIYGINNVTILDVLRDPEGLRSNLVLIDLLRICPRRNNFRGQMLKVLAMDDYKEEVKYVDNLNDSLELESGASYNTLQDFVYTLNFTYEPIMGLSWMTDINGTLDGIGMQIENGEADICISTATMTINRVFRLQFLAPVSSVYEAFIFYQQPAVLGARDIFIMPFSSRLWCVIGVTWIFLGFSIFLLALYKGPVKFRHVGTSNFYSKYRHVGEKFPASDTIIWVLGVLCQQGWWTSPAKIPLRIVFITTFLASVLLYGYYSAAYVAAVSKPSPPIKTFTDFKKFGYTVFTNPSVPTYTIGFVSGQENDRLLAKSALYYVNDSDAMEKVMKKNSKFAHIVGADGFYPDGLNKYKDPELCKVERMSANVPFPMQDAMFLKKGSEHQEIFFGKNLAIMERGLMNRYWTNYKINTQLTCLPPVQSLPQLSFFDCYLAFLVMVTGHLSALLFIMIERRKVVHIKSFEVTLKVVLD